MQIGTGIVVSAVDRGKAPCMPPSKAEVQRALKEYEPRLRSIFERAWNEWRQVAAFMSENGMGPVLYQRTIANFVFDAIARHAVDELGSDDAVHTKVEAQTVKFVFGGEVLARFKKGDENKLGRNIPTQAAMTFEDADGLFPGLPPETAKVEFVWRPNEIYTQLEEVLVVARDGKEKIWDYPIAAESGAEVVSLPSSPSPDPDIDDLVRPKVPNEQELEDE